MKWLYPLVVKFFAICLLSACFISCKNKTETEEVKPPVNNGTYFSIKQFAADQWYTHYGQPYGVIKISFHGNKPDSTLTNSFDIEWGMILKTFFESDISDRKYIGHYNFSAFEDETTKTKNYYYEAKDDNLFTRKLQIMFSASNGRVQTIYIETAKKTAGSTRIQRLMYMPAKLISIQEFAESNPGAENDVRLEYRFLN